MVTSKECENTIGLFCLSTKFAASHLDDSRGSREGADAAGVDYPGGVAGGALAGPIC
jgi:hypothetical protein